MQCKLGEEGGTVLEELQILKSTRKTNPLVHHIISSLLQMLSVFLSPDSKVPTYEKFHSKWSNKGHLIENNNFCQTEKKITCELCILLVLVVTKT